MRTICIKNILCIRPEWWMGYRAVAFSLGRLSVYYMFLGWRNKSWRNGDKDALVWKLWNLNPIFGFKNWKDGRYTIIILFNNFTFRKIPTNAMDIYYMV